MEAKIISRETIKPSSPTPDHSRTYNLCYFDQIASHVYTQSILFYSANHENTRDVVSDHLKKSLSQTLTHYYPFAGQIKDDITIDCNDEGVTFVEAQLSCDMSFVLENSDVEKLQQLSPCQPHVPVSRPKSEQELVVVQVNYFACGGMAICACISHIIADASATANFLKSWGAFARGDYKIGSVIYDCRSLFPTRDLSMFYRVMGALHGKTHVESSDKVVEKSFIFDGPKIVALRKEMEDALNNSYRPSRVLSVMGLIWEALIDATADGVSPIRAVSNTVNLRTRMNPPLPQCIGNVFALAMATATTGEIVNRTSLSTKIHNSIKQFDDVFIRKMFTETKRSGEGFDELLLKKIEEFGNGSKFGLFLFTSLCRSPFYETDFGWGKPTWFGSASSFNRIGYVADSSDDEGIEARIALSEEEMVKFEQHPAILEYATYKPSI